jgi:hypothetical protein
MGLKIEKHRVKTKYMNQFGENDLGKKRNVKFFCNKRVVRASIRIEEHVSTQRVLCFFIQLQFGLKSRDLVGPGFFYFCF